MFLDLTTTTYRSFFEIPDRWIASVSQDWVQPTDWHKQAFDLSHFHCKRKTSSVQFSGLVMSDSLRPHGLQHARPPCPLPTPGVYSNSCSSSRWCHPTISSSVIPFSHPQSFPASESFPVSQLFSWGGQSSGVSALASFLPRNTQGWSPLFFLLFYFVLFL